MEMAASPGQCIALQAFNMVKEAISGCDNPLQKSQDDSSECASSASLFDPVQTEWHFD